MYRTLFALVALVALVALGALIGCKKKSDDAGSGGGGGGDSQTPTDTTLYTIKIAKRDKDTKWQIIKEKTDKTVVTTTKGDETVMKKEKADYIETILASENDKPTKLTRAYRYAQKSDKSGTLQDLPYSGKTVLIEKKGDLYTFTADGRALAPRDTEALLDEFKPKKRSKGADSDEKWLPQKPVRVGEKWEIPFDDEGDGIIGKATGRLMKAYRDKNGKQCGAVTVEGVMTLPKEPGQPEKMAIAMTREGPIDGSSGEAKATLKISANWKINDPKAGELAVAIEIVETRTASAVE